MSTLFVVALKIYLLVVLIFMVAAFCIWVARPAGSFKVLLYMLGDCFRNPFLMFTPKGWTKIKKSFNQR